MMTQATLPEEEILRLFKEAVMAASKVDGLTVIERNGVKDKLDVHWCGANPAFSKT